MAAYCWGSIINGPLGGIEEELLLYPREIDWTESSKLSKVSCGPTHTLFLTSEGQTYSCGNNDYGQLGQDLLPRKRPQLIPALEGQQIVQICAGDEHSLALNSWGQIYSWGADSRGQLGQNQDGLTSSTSILTYPKIMKSLNMFNIIQVASGYHHNLALSNSGELFSWGANNYGQLGLGTQSSKETVPKLVTSLAGVPIAFIACGAYHSFAISKSGAVFGWGKNCQGQLGLNDEKMRIYPTQLKTLRSLGVRYIACGEEFSAFLTQDGGVFTCGQGKFGQLGHGSDANENLPRKVAELMGSTITQLACGKRHTLVYVPTRERIYSFGIGSSGQLGGKQATDSLLPQVVQGPWVANKIIKNPELKVKEIFSGGDISVATIGNDPSIDFPSTDFRDYDPKSQVLVLTEELSASCAEVPSDVNCDLDLITAVEVIMKSQACFNASCLLPNNRHMCCTSRNHGINLEEAKAIFTNLRRIENSSLKEIIFDGITKGLIPSLQTNPPDVEALRVYVLLPLYHEFVNTKNYKSLHTPFAFAVSAMNEIAQRILVKYWTEIDYFEQIVNNYRNIVSYIINFKFHTYNIPETGQEIKVIVDDPDLIAALNFLTFLYRINQTDRKYKCPYELFVLPELSDMALEVQNDYFNWLKSPASFHLCNYPFLFDGKVKASILRTDQLLQMQAAMQEHTATSIFHHFFRMNLQPQPAFVVLNVSRENIVDDTIRELTKYDPRELKRPLKVKFQNEEAEDAGGVTKEFFLLLIKEILDPKYGMFKEYEESRLLWFSNYGFVEEENYWLVGVICGLAIYNNTIINMPFPLCLYTKLLNEQCGLSDLKELSPITANSMQSILDYDGDDFVDTFDLRFEITTEVFGEKQTALLKPNGDEIQVTQANKKEFVDLYVEFVLYKSVSKQFNAFYNGFMKVVGGRVLQLFKPHELMAVIVGNEDYDWHALETEAIYKNGYTSGDQVIRWFWAVFHSLDNADKKKFLLFLTGSDRIPIQGMKQIKIIIQATSDDKCLPVAHTCFNLLDLPRYGTKERLRYKLLQAIQQTQGFSLV